MEEDCGSRLQQQCWPGQSSNLNSTSFVPVQGMHYALPPAYTSLYNQCMASVDESPTGFTAVGSPQMKLGQANETHRWFYCLPRHRQALTPVPKSTAKGFGPVPDGCNRDVTPDAVSSPIEKRFLVLEEPRAGKNPVYLADPSALVHKSSTKGFGPVLHGCNKDVQPDAISRPVEKRFLVFDQSGNRTNLILRSINGSPIHCPPFGNPETFRATPIEASRTVKSPIYQTDPNTSYGLSDDQESDEVSEMHEDTEELNALLYSSDDDNDDDYDEDTSSTGHSPSQKEIQSVQEVNGIAEEVASSGGGPTERKRKRSSEEDCVSSPLMDTASSGEPNGSYECEEDDEVETSCAESRNFGREIGSSSSLSSSLAAANKRMKRVKIRETINILQSIIPGGKGKDAMLVLDEAIQYLKSLKLKAKSLGDEDFRYW